ncbi:hypothetical protein [Acidisphaera sp. L21]|uniref:hypothetical protein n=1 Tax=Acidisphaera sp. L21 TaxID=1641851 RepID=UPI00131BCCBA|nr:hypothetical protein [Acidisphaera sp. L21]
MTEPKSSDDTHRQQDDAAQKRVKDTHAEGGGKAGTGEAMGSPDNDRQDTERAAEGKPHRKQ